MGSDLIHNATSKYNTASHQSRTMFMIQKDQSNGSRSDSKHEDDQQPILHIVQLAFNPRKGLRGSNIQVHATGNRQNHADGNIRRLGRQHQHSTECHEQSGRKVENGTFHDAQSGMLGEQNEIRQFLRHFVKEGGEDDGDGSGGRAGEEGGADENSVGKIVEGVSDENGGTEAFVDLGLGTEGFSGGRISVVVRLGDVLSSSDGIDCDGDGNISVGFDVALARCAFFIAQGNRLDWIVRRRCWRCMKWRRRFVVVSEEHGKKHRKEISSHDGHSESGGGKAFASVIIMTVAFLKVSSSVVVTGMTVFVFFGDAVRPANQIHRLRKHQKYGSSNESPHGKCGNAKVQKLSLQKVLFHLGGIAPFVFQVANPHGRKEQEEDSGERCEVN
mmetsp:Transcript_1843/g.3442  ORF Transcript_1843/g.3442 Transcript_1843/m.3442 type:complete len:387 (+) Transcript_1843:105-1265(+)